ncbi:MAG: GAF domain-containing protein [Opitutae bacterium]|nr:GAF domain-containing protein [Opitutae bacterium]MBC9889275.1 GAF domain-containing protein [Opitutae bacterium]
MASDSLIHILYRIRVIGHEAGDPRQAMAEIAEVVQRYFGANGVAVTLINPDTRQLEIEVNRGFLNWDKEVFLPVGRGIIGWVALHAKPMVVDEVEKDPRRYHLAPAIKSQMACPLRQHEQVIGVISVGSGEKAAFNRESVATLQMLADETTQILGQMWLIGKLRTRSEQLEALLSMGQDFVSKLDLDDLLQTITREAHKIMQCRLAMMLILDKDRDTLKIHTICGARQSYQPFPEISPIDSSFGAAIQLKRQLEVFDIRKSEDEHFWNIVSGENLVSMVCSPILWENEVVGVLAAYSDKPHRASNEEKRIFNMLAGFSGVAVQNLRLYALMLANEEHLKNNEKLITLGLIAAEIAHEIRNPLTVIKLLFGSMNLQFPTGDERWKDLSVIDDKIRQLEQIVERVLNIGKSSETLFLHWDLRELLEDSVRLVRPKLNQHKITTQLNAGGSSLVINGNRGHVEQVLLNLILNAIQAMEKGGTITFDCYDEEKDQTQYACIEITDTGTGIDDEWKHRIFDSFLTSRPGGTGLGLSIVKRILKSHLGDIEVKKTGPDGTTMKLWLPLVQPPY